VHIHLVLVKLADPADRERCRSEMLRMDGAIDGMVDLAVVTNECGGDHAADIALRTRWVDSAAYRAYERHPLHLEVRAVVLSLTAEALTIDYTAGNPGG
jgi:hypothetical protein